MSSNSAIQVSDKSALTQALMRVGLGLFDGSEGTLPEVTISGTVSTVAMEALQGLQGDLKWIFPDCPIALELGLQLNYSWDDRVAGREREYVPCTEQDFDALITLLKVQNLAFTDLKLSRVIGDSPERPTHLVDAVAQSSLSKLSICHSPQGWNQEEIYQRLFAKGTSLQNLTLYDCGLSDVGVSYLLRAMTKLPSFGSLDLWKNQIGPDGAKMLAEWLTQGTTSVKSLDVSENPIGDVGMGELMKGALSSDALHSLGYSSRNFDSIEAAQRFASLHHELCSRLAVGDDIQRASAWKKLVWFFTGKPKVEPLGDLVGQLGMEKIPRKSPLIGGMQG